MDLRKEFEEYRTACWGDDPLPPMQAKEIEQAFLAGCVVVAAKAPVIFDDDARREIVNYTRRRCMELGSFPLENN